VTLHRGDFYFLLCRQQVEGATISTIAKGRFTAQLDVMQKELFVEKKALLAARVEQELEAVKQVRICCRTFCACEGLERSSSVLVASAAKPGTFTSNK
jgi:hypothetical protein